MVLFFIFVYFRNSLHWQLVGCAIVSLVSWLAVIFFLRYSLKLLFMYKGWMYEQRGRGSRISARTKLWLLLVKVLSGWNKPKLYSFQGSLPRLPLPSLHSTMNRVSTYQVIVIFNDTSVNKLIQQIQYHKEIHF